MRDIKLPVRYKSKHLLHPSDRVWDEALEIRKLGGRINSAALAIEDVIVDIVSTTMLREVKAHRQTVIGALLKTDACSFSAKRKLLLACIDTFGLLQAGERNELDRHLSKVSSYRNAFVHGDLMHNGTVHELRYFQGQPRVTELSDAFLEELQEHYLSAWALLEKAQAAALRVDS